MWHIMSDGFGGYLAWQEGGDGGALGEGIVDAMIFGIAALFAWLGWVMGDALMLPLACLVFILLVCAVAASFGSTVDEGFAAFAVIALIPVLLYAWGCMCWGMIYVTDHSDLGYLAFLAYLLAGIFMLTAAAFIATEGEMPVLGLVFAGAQLVIWWAAMGARSYGNEGVADILKYTFRILGLVSVGCLALFVVGSLIGMLRRSKQDKASSFNGVALAWDAATIAIGFVPLVLFGMLPVTSGIALALVMLMAYAVIAAVICNKREHEARLIGLVVGYLALFFCYLITRADMSVAIPLDAGNVVIDTLNGSALVQSMGSIFEGVALSLAALFETVLHFVLSLVFRIFDAEAPFISMNCLMSGLLGFAALCMFTSIGMSVAAALKKKK
jgi:hypothetical protein